MRPSDAEITRHHHDNRPDSDAWVEGYVQTPFRIVVAEYDERWPADFDRVATAIRDAIGNRALEIHHVGSTSVEGLPAKPVIDVDLVVADPADEPSYVPALVAAGFVHVIREPWWHEHRVLRGADPVSHVHVFGPTAPGDQEPDVPGMAARAPRRPREVRRRERASRRRTSRGRRGARAAMPGTSGSG